MTTAWIDEFDLRTGTVLKSFRVPGVRYPSDTNEIAPGRYLTADYSKTGTLKRPCRSRPRAGRQRVEPLPRFDRPKVAASTADGVRSPITWWKAWASDWLRSRAWDLS
jgi:hypothetical protein